MGTFVEKLQHVSEEQFLERRWSQDLLGRKLTKEIQLELTNRVKAEGENAGEKLRSQFPDEKPSEIAEALGIKVNYRAFGIDEKFTSIGYFESPDLIVVNETMKEKDPFFKKLDVDFMRFDSWKEIVIAHELFHYIQEGKAEKEKLFCDQYQVELWKLGPYKHTSKLSILGEIAGTYFAKTLLDLSFYPELVEWFLMYAYFPEKTEEKLACFGAEK